MGFKRRIILKNQSDKKIKIGLVQISEIEWQNDRETAFQMKSGFLIPKVHRSSDNFKVEGSQCFVYLPYSVGLLQAYAQKYAMDSERYEFIPAIYKRTQVDEAVEYLSNADVAGFSVYVWNIRISLAIAQKLKKQNPNVLIVFGGLQVPKNAENFLRENPFIDIVGHGEGEKVFLEILENSGTGNWESIQSVSYINKNNQYVNHPTLNRINDLSTIPSPYLEGVFDELIQTNPDISWMYLWETNRGCPFSCSYCDWGGAITNKVYRFDMERVKAEIDYFAENNCNHLCLCDANFGIYKRDIDIVKYLVEAYKKHQRLFSLVTQDTKNDVNRTYEIYNILAESRQTLFHSGANLSVQSLDRQTLENIKRHNISTESFNELHRRFSRKGISTLTDIILGLPGETYDTFVEGISHVLKNGQHSRIAFYICSILPNAEMSDPDYQKRFGLESVPVRTIHEYSSLDDKLRGEYPEYIDAVIATKDMNRDDWIRTRIFAWMADFLHYDRLLRIAFIILAEYYNISYRNLIEVFMNTNADRFPICSEISEILFNQAKSNQSGDSEHIPSKELLNIWWPADQYALVKIVIEKKLDSFYEEAKLLLSELCKSLAINFDPTILEEAINLNQNMFKTPGRYKDIDLTLEYNIYEFYRGVLDGVSVPLEKKSSQYHIDCTSQVWVTWESWCRYGIDTRYRRDQMLYPITVVD